MAGLDVKVSQLGEVVVASDNDLLNLVTYDEQNQTYVSGKAKLSTMKDYMIGDTDISGLGDGSATGAIDALDDKIDDNYDEWKEQWKKNGAYNILENKGVSQVITTGGANITVTKQANGEMWIYGTTTTNPIYIYLNKIVDCDRDYKLVGTPPSSNPNYAYHIFAPIYRKSDNALVNTVIDYGQGAIVPAGIGLYCTPQITIKENQTIPSNNPIKFKPMITTDLNATYADYVPYAKTNRELTELVDDKFFSYFSITDPTKVSFAYGITSATVVGLSISGRKSKDNKFVTLSGWIYMKDCVYSSPGNPVIEVELPFTIPLSTEYTIEMGALIKNGATFSSGYAYKDDAIVYIQTTVKNKLRITKHNFAENLVNGVTYYQILPITIAIN